MMFGVIKDLNLIKLSVKLFKYDSVQISTMSMVSVLTFKVSPGCGYGQVLQKTHFVDRVRSKQVIFPAG